MRACAYVRVSSRAQSCEMQMHAIERAARARGDRIEAWYVERRSGKTLAREILAELRRDARAGICARRLYVYRLDRLARSGIRDMFEVVEELRAVGVEIVTVADGFALEGPQADIVLAVMAWAAQMERLAINERIASARDRVEARGGRWGRRREIDAKTLARARAMKRAKKSIRAIAVALKVKRSTLHGALSRKDAPPRGAKSSSSLAPKRGSSVLDTSRTTTKERSR